jgi:hypothetical protein
METAKRTPDDFTPPGHTAPAPHAGNSSVAAIERRVEQLVAEIGQTIRAAEPERRAELKELADTLLRDEVSSIVDTPSQSQSAQRRNSSHPLFAGLLLVVLGGGFLLILPAMGFAIAFIGVVLAAWGGFISWFRK